MELTQPLATGKRPPWSRTFSALRHRDFRLYWAALTISQLGIAFQTVAQAWLVYRLTGSATMLGVAAFLPALLSAPGSILGGMLADRISRRRLVILTQSSLTLPPLGLAYLSWTGQVQVWHVIVASSVLGFVAAVDMPARTAMVPHLVNADDLLNAQGLSSAMYQVTRIVGPALAGLAIASVGEAVCFLINGVSYLAMVVALLLVRPTPIPARSKPRGLRAGMREGVGYILRTPAILGVFAVLAVQGLFLYPYVTLLPVFASDILHIGAAGLGGLTTAVGAGALLGALGIANLGHGRRGRVMLSGGLVMPFALLGLAWSRGLPLSVPMLMLLGIGTVMITTICSTTLLTVVPDDVRGRVNALAIMVYFGAMYGGGLPAGVVADRWGAPVAVSLSAALLLLSIGWVWVRFPQVAQIE